MLHSNKLQILGSFEKKNYVDLSQAPNGRENTSQVISFRHEFMRKAAANVEECRTSRVKVDFEYFVLSACSVVHEEKWLFELFMTNFRTSTIDQRLLVCLLVLVECIYQISQVFLLTVNLVS